MHVGDGEGFYFFGRVANGGQLGFYGGGDDLAVAVDGGFAHGATDEIVAEAGVPEEGAVGMHDEKNGDGHVGFGDLGFGEAVVGNVIVEEFAAVENVEAEGGG